MRLSIRRMDGRDLGQVLEIERHAFPVPWSERTFRGLLRGRDAVLLVAEGEGLGPRAGPGDGVLGYAVLWRAGEEAELGNIAVHEAARGRGVGAELLRAITAEAEGMGAKAVYLEVRASNARARRLYEREGFREAGRRPGYYTRPREDALVMRRELR